MDDGVKYRGRIYRVEGINTKNERPVALVSPDNELDRGCVRFKDIEGIVVRGPGDVEQIAMASRLAYIAVMIGLVGKGEPEDGVYVVSDANGVVHWDHDGRELEPGTSDFDRANGDHRVAARREANKPNPNWWDGFEKSTPSEE